MSRCAQSWVYDAWFNVTGRWALAAESSMHWNYVVHELCYAWLDRRCVRALRRMKCTPCAHVCVCDCVCVCVHVRVRAGMFVHSGLCLCVCALSANQSTCAMINCGGWSTVCLLPPCRRSTLDSAFSFVVCRRSPAILLILVVFCRQARFGRPPQPTSIGPKPSLATHDANLANIRRPFGDPFHRPFARFFAHSSLTIGFV